MKSFEPMFLASVSEGQCGQTWDMRDGEQEWTLQALAAKCRYVCRRLCCLTSQSQSPMPGVNLEIERSTVNGKAYQTGGGRRSVKSNVIDVLLTWMVNRDPSKSLEGGTRRRQTRN